MKKKLIILAKEMDFKEVEEYFDYLIECHINGSFTSCKRLFSEMKKEDQKQFVRYIPMHGSERVYNFYFSRL